LTLPRMRNVVCRLSPCFEEQPPAAAFS
jgi:hypothetical protein